MDALVVVRPGVTNAIKSGTLDEPVFPVWSNFRKSSLPEQLSRPSNSKEEFYASKNPWQFR